MREITLYTNVSLITFAFNISRVRLGKLTNLHAIYLVDNLRYLMVYVRIKYV